MENRVCHFEIPADNPEQLTQFYGKLFGWQFMKADTPGMTYHFAQTGSTTPGIDGAIMQRVDPQQPWMNYVLVESIDATLNQAEEMGAVCVLPKTEVPGMGWYAAMKDPQGNICGLWQSAQPAA